ncbi:MAG TPA: hypothetical protein VLT45_11160 [Kofleriaceae bacterium]|nr:hypothetical protein [Kofleriaceae bacterium]
MKRLVLALSLLAACGGSSSSGGPDGMVAGDGAGSGSSSQGGDTLYPLSLGEHWTFTVTAVGAGSVCAPGTYTQSIVSANPVGGRAAFQMTSFCTGVTGAYDYAAGSGDEVDFNYNGTWGTLIDGNLTEGHSWPYFNTSYHWERTTVAGHSDCWKAVQDVTYTAYLTYCRGAGLVESYSMDLAGNGWDAKLD